MELQEINVTEEDMAEATERVPWSGPGSGARVLAYAINTALDRQGFTRIGREVTVDENHIAVAPGRHVADDAH